MHKLKPCPFCGDVAMLYTAPKQIFYAVDCINCGASIESEDYDEVIALWNRRAEPEVKVGCWLENTDGTHFCSECQSEAHGIVFDTLFTENLDDYCYNCGAKMEREQQ